LRERRKISQEDLAERLKVARQTVSRYEQGRSAVLRVDVQRNILEALGATREELDTELRLVGAAGVRAATPEARPGAPHGEPEVTFERTPPTAGTRRSYWPVAAHPVIGPDGEFRFVPAQAGTYEDMSWLEGHSWGLIRLPMGLMRPAMSWTRIAVFDRAAFPRVGQGVVVEMREGYLRAGVFDGREDGGGIRVRKNALDKAPQLIPLGAYTGVYAIRMFID
jgi:transcriptional regulator with XRE-family HTH domain